MKAKRLLFQAAFVTLLSLLPAAKAKAEPFVIIDPLARTGYVGTTVDFYGGVINVGEETISIVEANGGHESDLFGFLINTEPFFDNPGV
ncbi:MAG TPA: hypothetical protein VM870_05500, partial [Pyrinomonadaceae bacterium]|nr:hypothetical protein [Pyrinomonadaceae bacterium]